MQELLHLDQIENFTLVAKGYATDTRPIIMHPIGSFAQALLDVASKPLQPILEVHAFNHGALHSNITGIRLVVKT